MFKCVLKSLSDTELVSDIEHIELKFISTFEARDRESKLDKILSDDFDNLFNLD